MYRLTPDQQQIVDRVAALADKEIAPNAAKADAEGSYPQASMDALAREGFLGLTIAPEYGGMGQGLRVMAAVLDTIAQRCASTAMCYKMHLSGVAAYAASANKPADLLRAAARGEHVSTLAWSEFGSRSHFWAPVSQETRSNGRVTLNASKSMVTSAGRADGYVVSTKWSEAKNPTDTMLYVVLPSDGGLRVAGPWSGLGMRGNASAPMVLKDVSIPAERALSEPGKGFDMMLSAVLPVFNLGNAAISVGIAEAAVESTRQHITKSRYEHLNMTLADIPTERARLAQMRIETDKARAHLVSTLDAVEHSDPGAILLVLGTKAAAAEAAVQVTDIGMRACGGTAFGKHLSIERNFRDARAGLVMGPTSDMIQEFIGRALCGMELF